MTKRLIIFMLLAGLFSGCLFFVFYPVLQIPEPTGPYGVGQRKYHWVDFSRKELNVSDLQHPNREIMAYVFYPSSLHCDGTGPTEKNEAAALVAFDYDAADSAMEYLSSCSWLPKFLFSSLKFIKTHSIANALLAPSSTPFPVIIFSHGAGGPMVQSYTRFLEELASYGFVVVGINHPYIAGTVRYPGGYVVKSMYRKKARNPEWKLAQLETNAHDVSFVITKIKEFFDHNDEFWHCVDVDKIGMLGHSFGGATTIRATRKDKRIKCGMNLEGGLHGEDVDNPFSTPFMFLMAEKSFLWNKDHPRYPKKAKPSLDAFSRLVSAKGTKMEMVIIKDVGHSVFSDLPLQLNMTLFTRFLSWYIDFVLELAASKAANVLANDIMPHIINFFDVHLKDNSSKIKKYKNLQDSERMLKKKEN